MLQPRAPLQQRGFGYEEILLRHPKKGCGVTKLSVLVATGVQGLGEGKRGERGSHPKLRSIFKKLIRSGCAAVSALAAAFRPDRC